MLHHVGRLLEKTNASMNALIAFLFYSVPAWVLAHPGGGIIALSEDSAIIADSVENFVWRVAKGEESVRLVAKFHGHWLTRGLDGKLYAEAFQESGGAWSSAAFRLKLPEAKLTEVAHRRDLEALVFAVDSEGSLVFQRGGSLVVRKNGQESPFQMALNAPKLREVTAYAWNREGDLVFADRNRIYQTDTKGVTHLIAEIAGKVLEPKIWNGTEIPAVFSLALDKGGHVLAAVPSLGTVYRVEPQHKLPEIARADGGWRATGVAAFGDSIFLMESDSRASTSPRVRILRGDGTIDLLTVQGRAK